MNFSALKEFKKTQATELLDVISYLAIDLVATIRELRVGLTNMSFDDNFDSFAEAITIPAGAELPIRNRLKGIPTEWIVVRTNQYGLSVCDGDTAWSQDYLYLKNTAGSAAVLTVRFFR